MLLEIQNGTVSRNGAVILSHFHFEIRGTEKAAIVGKNGSGKTTLLEILDGRRDLDQDDRHPDAGMMSSRTFQTAMLHQNAVRYPDDIVSECVRRAFQERREGDFQEFRIQFERTFTKFGFPKEDLAKKLKEFSGGEQTKIMLILMFLIHPEVLILDEPTNYLDVGAIEWLEDAVRQYDGSVIYVSHDRYFIDRTADVVWEIRNKKTIRYAGNYTQYKEQRKKLVEKQKQEYRAQQAEIKRLDALIEKFRQRPRKAAFARSRKKILERMQVVEKPAFEDTIRIKEIVPMRPGSRIVFESDRLLIGYDRPLKEISFRLRRGQKIGVIGPNGSGKSTFLKTLTGKISPYEGAVLIDQKADLSGRDEEHSDILRKLRIGRNIDFAYFDQFSSDIRSSKTIIEYFSDLFPILTKSDIRAYLAGFLFRGEDLGKRVSDLSGGEKSRLVLAEILYRKPNFLILDEPTSHMDIPAKEAIESILMQYKGTVLFVSHDRYFLSRLADGLLLFEPGSSEVTYFPGSYDSYQKQKKKSTSGADPHMVRSLEEQRLIEGLRSVPSKSYLPKELSTDAARSDWKFTLNQNSREAAEERFAAADNLAHMLPETQEELTAWDAIKKERADKADQAERIWTDYLIEWYEIWLDTPEGSMPGETF